MPSIRPGDCRSTGSDDDDGGSADEEGSVEYRLVQLGYVAEQAGDLVDARRKHLDALVVASGHANIVGIARAFEGLAGVAAANPDAELAATILGCAEQLRAAVGANLVGGERIDIERAERYAREQLGDDGYRKVHEAGRELQTDAILARVMTDDERTVFDGLQNAPEVEAQVGTPDRRDERSSPMQTSLVEQLSQRELAVLRRLPSSLCRPQSSRTRTQRHDGPTSVSTPEEAFALLGLGRSLVAIGRAGDAAYPLVRARAIFERLKAAPALAGIAELSKQAGVARVGAGSDHEIAMPGAASGHRG